MINVNRRSFLRQTTAGAAAVAIVAAAPAAMSGHALPTPPSIELSGPTMTAPLMAYVRNVTAGEIALMVGTREVVIRDVDLARRLMKAAS